MGTAGRAYVLSAAIVLVAMAGRAGWIDWPAVAHAASTGLIGAVGVAAFLALAAVVVGIPLALVIAATAGVLRLLPARPAGEPSA